MAIVFLFVGIAAIAIGVRGQAKSAGQLLASEFTGPNSFIEWFAAIAILGVIGFYRPVRPAANAMLGLVILAIFLRRGQGFFDTINTTLTQATAAPRPSSAAGASSPGAAQPSPAAPGASILPSAQTWEDWLAGVEHFFGIGANDPAGKAINNAVPTLPSLNLPGLNFGPPDFSGAAGAPGAGL